MNSIDYAFDADFDHLLGAADAPQTIVAYESLTCPHCREFMEQVFPQIQAEFIKPQKARYVLREVYLDEAGLMAAAMLRALPKSMYFPTVEKLYDRQLEWTQGTSLADIANNLVQIGTEQGAREFEIMHKMNDTELIKTLVQHSERHLAEDQVRGTPTIFVNGQRVQDWRFENLSNLIS